MVVYKQIMKNSFRAFIPKFTIITVTYFGYHLTQILLFASCLHQSPKPTASKSLSAKRMIQHSVHLPC